MHQNEKQKSPCSWCTWEHPPGHGPANARVPHAVPEASGSSSSQTSLSLSLGTTCRWNTTSNYDNWNKVPAHLWQGVTKPKLLWANHCLTDIKIWNAFLWDSVYVRFTDGLCWFQETQLDLKKDVSSITMKLYKIKSKQAKCPCHHANFCKSSFEEQISGASHAAAELSTGWALQKEPCRLFSAGKHHRCPWPCCSVNADVYVFPPT